MRLLIYEYSPEGSTNGFNLCVEREIEGEVDVTTLSNTPSYAYNKVCLSEPPLSVSCDTKEMRVWLPAGCRIEILEKQPMPHSRRAAEAQCSHPENLPPVSCAMNKTEDSAKSSTEPQAAV